MAQLPQLSGLVVVSKIDELPEGISKIIGTHEGSFHCDEALACAMLLLLPEFEKAAIIRTRDEALLAKCDIVVDVGAVYDHEKRRYDHHQRGFAGVMDEYGFKTKLSSAGLIYRHYGKQVISRIASSAGARSHVSDVDFLHRKIYKSFIEEIDGIDNGVEAFDGARNYEVSSTLSGRIGRLNPQWNQPSGDEVRNARFADAVQLTGGEFASFVEDCVSSWLPARTIVSVALEGAAAVDSSQQILVLSQNCPWASHIFEVEREREAAGEAAAVGTAKFSLYNDGKTWRVAAVPIEEGSFTSRRALPEAWRGVKGADLDQVTGIEGCTFVHAGGFIGGNQTFEGAVAMAKKAIAE